MTAPVSPGVPGAPAAGTSAANLTPQSPRPERDAPPVQASDGVADFEAQVLASLGLDTPDTPEPPAKPARQKTDKAAVIEDEDADLGETEDDDDATVTTDDFDPDAPVLGEDGEEEDADAEADGEADAESAKDASKLKKDNYKLREERRELREKLAAAEAAAEAARQEAAQAAAAGGGLPEFGGYYAGVKTPDDVDAVVARIEADLDYLEDNLEGYSFTDAKGTLIEVDADQAKAYRRQARESLRAAEQVRKVLTTHSERAAKSETTARKKYPFVFDSKSPHNARVLDLAKEHPGLAKDPARALALGRMVIGTLVESGEYTLVKRGKPAAPAATAPARKPAAPRAPAAPASPSAASGAPPPNGHRPPDLEALAMALFEDAI